MNRRQLVEALELIRPALASSNVIPVFQCFTFKDGEVTAYDDQIAIVGPTDCESSFGVHGASFLGLLSNSGAEVVELTLENQEVKIKLGKSVSKLPYIAVEDFLFDQTEAGDFSGDLDVTVSLIEAMRLCLETVSSDETQIALHGVTLQGDTMYSCNGDTITRVRLKKGIGKNRILMPTKFCTSLIKLWDNLQATKAKLSFSEKWVHFKVADEWSVFGQVLEIKEPIDFEALIKRTMKGKATPVAVPAELNEALARARVLADVESKMTAVTISAGKMTLLTETPQGEVKDTLMIKDHVDIEANVNASHIQKALKICDTMAIQDNCTVFERAPNVLLIVSNMG